MRKLILLFQLLILTIGTFAQGKFFGGDGSGFSAQTNSSNQNLPVELMYFRAHNNTNFTIFLDWATSSETDNDFFSVEKSENGLDFVSIGDVKGKGNSNKLNYYSYEDTPGVNENIIYYRLRQVDFDGGYEYSEIVSISVMSKLQINIYPNPTENKISIESTIDFEKVAIVGLSGSEPSYQYLEMKARTIDLTKVKPGYYYLVLFSKKAVSYKKIVKL